MSELKNRIDFVYLFDVQDGNPNGDPDAGNLPRVDAETGMGLVTDVCLKRKVRNYVQVSKECAEGYDIFIKEKAVLDSTVERTYNYDEVKKADAKDMKNVAKKLLCKNFFDIRTFGAVIATKGKQDQVRGPIQLTFARSVEPIAQMEHSITRMAVTKEEDLEQRKNDGPQVYRSLWSCTSAMGLYLCQPRQTDRLHRRRSEFVLGGIEEHV
jgi:CRISPR-associated protein Csd2